MNSTPIPKEIKEIMLKSQFYDRCSVADKDCCGRVTWEHCWMYAGKQIQEVWAIIPLCWEHHLGKHFKKDLGQYLSLLRASDEDLAKYPKKDWEVEFRKLHFKYGDERVVLGFRLWCKLCGEKLYH